MARTPSPRRSGRPARRITEVGRRRVRSRRPRERRRTRVYPTRARSPEYPGVSPDYDYGGLVPYDRDFRPEPQREFSPLPDLSDDEIMRNAYREMGYSEADITRELRGSKKKKKGKKSKGKKKKGKKGKGKKSKGKKSKERTGHLERI